MIIAEKKNDSELMMLVPSIKNHMSEWQIINIKIVENSVLSQKEIIKHFYDQYRKYEGMIYPVSPRKIVMLVRLGIIENYAVIKSDIEQKIPNHCCRILLRQMSKIGIKQVQIDLTEKDTSINLTESMYKQRETRKDNVILIVDDDPFIRKTMSILLTSCGEIIEASCGKEVVPAYLKHNPDILLLDIHMPDKTGLEIIPDLIELDSDSFIIVLSADSQKENVLKALELGAAGFLTKPPAREKIQEYLSQCITIQ